MDRNKRNRMIAIIAGVVVLIIIIWWWSAASEPEIVEPVAPATDVTPEPVAPAPTQ